MKEQGKSPNPLEGWTDSQQKIVGAFVERAKLIPTVVEIGASRLENDAIIIAGKVEDFEDEKTWQELGVIEENVQQENESEIIIFLGVKEVTDIVSIHSMDFDSSPSKPITVFKRNLF